MKKKLHLGRRPKEHREETNSTLEELKKELSCQDNQEDKSW